MRTLSYDPKFNMSHIAYFRVSTTDQSIESQRAALVQGRPMDREYTDEGVSGAVPAAQRPGFRALLDYIREGDTLHVYAVDRLGRDAIDIQSTIRELISKGVTVEIHGLGQIAKGVGELIIAVLAQVADMERQRIRERTTAGRELARATLAATGKTHRGKEGLGRPYQGDAEAVRVWRNEHRASIRATAEQFNLSPSTVKRYCAT
jgi:putative DNA-invertase from lambdoid prophage Rac